MQAVLVEFPLPEDEMPLNATDKAWVSQEIQNALKKKGWGKLIAFIKEWFGFGATIGLLLFAVTQYTAYVEFRTHTGDRLDSIESSLRTISAAQSPSKVLAQLAALSPPQLAKNLPALRKVSEQSPSSVSASPAVLKDVTFALTKVNPNTDDYWPSVLQFIEFASELYSPKAPRHGSPVNFTLRSTRGENLPPGLVIVLDGGPITDMTFIDSRIVFTDNPSYLNNIKFINCAFEFPNTNSPSPTEEAIGGKLLANGIQSATITGM